MGNKKTKSRQVSKKILIPTIAGASVVAVGLVFLLNSGVFTEDYYAEKYADDYNWYMGACTEAFDSVYESKTLLFCDCGYFEFRNKYGGKKIRGELSVVDVLGLGSAEANSLSKKFGKSEYVSDKELADRINNCYEAEISQYKEAHPSVNIDDMWNNSKRFIAPRRDLSKGKNT